MSQPSQQDLDSLCHKHWGLLYGMARNRGHDLYEAQDAVQEMFLCLIEHDQLITVVRMETPKQQASFLFTRLTWLLNNRRRDQMRQCRGGGIAIVSMSDENALVAEPADQQTPERQLAVAWVREILENAMKRLRAEMQADAWQVLEPVLRDDDSARGCAQPGAMRTALHRARQRLQWIITREVNGASCPRDAAMQLFGALR